MGIVRTHSVLAITAIVLAACGAPLGEGSHAHEADHAHHAGAANDNAAAGHAAAGHAAAGHAAAGHAAAGHATLPADEPADFSIYHSATVWTDQHGEERPLDSLAGRVQVVGMVYTSCAYACPRMLMDMKRIEGELGGAADVGFVMVSIDPARDTPARLAEYARGARLEGDRWVLLTGGDDDVLELAALLGVQYRRMANGEFVHSNFLSILDRDGRVAHRQMGLGADPAGTLAMIRSGAG
jgi:protein SCO1